MSDKRIAVIGAKGQLGQELQFLASQYPTYSFVFGDLEEVNITDPSSVNTFLDDVKAEVVVNCAAYTAVDKAEEEVALAEAVNVTGPANLAQWCATNHALLVHVSTDFVFNGENFSPYTEDQKAEPIGVYGSTKLKGEEAIAEQHDHYIILRTAWLYSSFGNNFCKTMLRLGKERDSLGIIYDQVGSPTYARDLGKAILDIVGQTNIPAGVYHYSNDGVASWYDFALAIFEMANLSVSAKPLLTQEYPTPAKRPHYSVLNKAKIKETFGIEIPYWRTSLQNCLNELQD